MTKPPKQKPGLQQDKKLLFVVGVAAALIIGLYILAS
jgi:hypothetical protein